MDSTPENLKPPCPVKKTRRFYKQLRDLLLLVLTGAIMSSSGSSLDQIQQLLALLQSISTTECSCPEISNQSKGVSTIVPRSYLCLTPKIAASCSPNSASSTRSTRSRCGDQLPRAIEVFGRVPCCCCAGARDGFHPHTRVWISLCTFPLGRRRAPQG